MYKCAVCVGGYMKDKRGCTTCKCRHYRKSSSRRNWANLAIFKSSHISIVLKIQIAVDHNTLEAIILRTPILNTTKLNCIEHEVVNEQVRNIFSFFASYG